MSKNYTEQILAYMNDHPRPYNVQNIYDNLHRQISKKVISDTLELLAKNKKIEQLVFGTEAGESPVNRYQSINELLQKELNELNQKIATYKQSIRKKRFDVNIILYNLAKSVKSNSKQLKSSINMLKTKGVTDNLLNCQYTQILIDKKLCFINKYIKIYSEYAKLNIEYNKLISHIKAQNEY